jgi:hypothetical protein
MPPSTMLKFFWWALTPQWPEIILETVVINFLSVLHSSNHGLRERRKMECKNLPVSRTSQLFCHSYNILCFAIGSKSRATDCALYTILPKVACLASKSAWVIEILINFYFFLLFFFCRVATIIVDRTNQDARNPHAYSESNIIRIIPEILV